MKLVSWNVNGLRACLGKGFLDYCTQENADVICLQETKLQPEQAVFELHGYHRFFYSAEKKGYSGTAILTKQAPLSVRYGLGLDEHDHEGRLITAEYPEFYLVCCYTPNSQDGLKRLDYRMQWEDALHAYLLRLDAEKPVVYCGDLNVAHEEIDIKNPKANRQNAGFSDEERAKMTRPLALPTRSAACTRIWQAYTRGGVTASMRAKITQAGVLTILLSPNGCCRAWFHRKSARTCSAATTARSCWNCPYDAGGIYRPLYAAVQ